MKKTILIISIITIGVFNIKLIFNKNNFKYHCGNVDALAGCESETRFGKGSEGILMCIGPSGQYEPITCCDFDLNYLYFCNAKSCQQ